MYLSIYLSISLSLSLCLKPVCSAFKHTQMYIYIYLSLSLFLSLSLSIAPHVVLIGMMHFLKAVPPHQSLTGERWDRLWVPGALILGVLVGAGELRAIIMGI